VCMFSSLMKFNRSTSESTDSNSSMWPITSPCNTCPLFNSCSSLLSCRIIWSAEDKPSSSWTFLFLS
jgi:hypothetical protein